MTTATTAREFNQIDFQDRLTNTLCKRLDGSRQLKGATIQKAVNQLQSLGYAYPTACRLVRDCEDMAVLIDEQEGGAKDRRDAEYRKELERAGWVFDAKLGRMMIGSK